MCQTNLIAPGPSPNGLGDYKQVMAKLKGDKEMTPQEQQMLLAKVRLVKRGRMLTRQIIFAGNGTTELNDHVVELPGLPSMYNYELRSDSVDTPQRESC